MPGIGGKDASPTNGACIASLKENELKEKMKIQNNNDNRDTADEFKHLPYYAALKDYDAAKWICFGTLTHANATSTTTQLARFKALMDAIGLKNKSLGCRLHYVVRVENDKGGKDDTGIHLHFLLGGHKVIDGHRHQFTKDEACTFLEKEWAYGISEVMPYESGKDGLGYILKCKDGPQSKEWDDVVEISPALMTLLKNKQRDPLAVEILAGLRRIGATAFFGDDVPNWQRV